MLLEPGSPESVDLWNEIRWTAKLWDGAYDRYDRCIIKVLLLSGYLEMHESQKYIE